MGGLIRIAGMRQCVEGVEDPPKMVIAHAALPVETSELSRPYRVRRAHAAA